MTTLLSLAVLLPSAALAAWACRRVRLPGALGELLVGLVLGPSIVGWVEPTETLLFLGNLGAVLLLFLAGLETRLPSLRSVGRAAVLAALLGVVVSMLGGMGLATLAGREAITAAFVGAALAATSVSIAVESLLGMGRLNSPAGQCVLGAAVIDDVLGVLALSGVTALVGGSNPLVQAARAVLFLVITWYVGSWLVARAVPRWAPAALGRGALLPWVGLLLGVAWLAEVAGGLAAITGAYLLGVLIARETDQRWELRGGAEALGRGLFIPLFFVAIGLQARLQTLWTQPGLLVALVALAVATKVVGSGGGALLGGLNRRESLLVGVGMVPRGEIALVVAGAGVGYGVLDEATFAALIGTSFLTTAMTPLLLYLVGRSPQPRAE